MNESEGTGSAEVTSELHPRTDTRPLAAVSTEGWSEAATAAGLAWLASLCVGAVCLIALKLQFSGLSGDSDPVEIFSAVVVMTLGLLRVPVHIGGLTLSALPLGALLCVGVSIGWAVAGSIGPDPTSVRRALRAGAMVGSVFAVVGLLLSLIFRIRARDPVAADAPWALVLTFLWGWLFATAGALWSPRRWLGVIAARAARWRTHADDEVGVWAGLLMVSISVVLALIALLVWIIVSLATDAPIGFDAGQAVAGFIYLLAFLPNVATAIVATSMGAPLLQGAQVGVGGEVVGGLREVSLLEWPGAPVLVYALLLIPALACGAGGWFLSLRSEQVQNAWRSLLSAAFVFAAVLAFFAWIGEARVGAGLVSERGVARVAVLPLPTFAWGMLWACAFGWFGRELGIRNRRG